MRRTVVFSVFVFFAIFCLYLSVKAQERMYPEGLPIPNFQALKSQAVEPSSMASNFWKTYQRALELNNDRFEDLNLIQIGDTVLFPGKNGHGVEAWIADKPVNGQHDCIWILTEKYLANELKTVPAYNPQLAPDNEIKWFIQGDDFTSLDDSSAKNTWWIILLSLIALGISFLLFMAIKAIRENMMNADNYPACGPNLNLVSNQETENYFRSFLKPGEKLVFIEKGFVRPIANEKTKRISVKMNFGDGKNRRVWLLNGEAVVRVIIQDRFGNNRSELYRSACANGFTSDGIMSLPATWEFVPYVRRSESTKQARTENSDVSENDVLKALESLGKFLDEVTQEALSNTPPAPIASKATNPEDLEAIGNLVTRLSKLKKTKVKMEIEASDTEGWYLKVNTKPRKK